MESLKIGGGQLGATAMALRCSASLWLLLVTSCVLAVCSGEIVDNQTFSDAPNQQTLPNKPSWA